MRAAAVHAVGLVATLVAMALLNATTPATANGLWLVTLGFVAGAATLQAISSFTADSDLGVHALEGVQFYLRAGIVQLVLLAAVVVGGDGSFGTAAVAAYLLWWYGWPLLAGRAVVRSWRGRAGAYPPPLRAGWRLG